MLTEKRKINRLSSALTFLQRYAAEGFLNQIVTGDETAACYAVTKAAIHGMAAFSITQESEIQIDNFNQ